MCSEGAVSGGHRGKNSFSSSPSGLLWLAGASATGNSFLTPERAAGDYPVDSQGLEKERRSILLHSNHNLFRTPEAFLDLISTKTGNRDCLDGHDKGPKNFLFKEFPLRSGFGPKQLSHSQTQEPSMFFKADFLRPCSCLRISKKTCG